MKSADSLQASIHKRFPQDHLLGDELRVDTLLQWITFFRRNLHRCAQTYLGISLHWYQSIVLYLMGVSSFFCWVAARAAAKSFIIGLYACCMCILYPGYMFVICSGTRGQAKLIVSKKIKEELLRWSPALQNEIEEIKDNQVETIVYFKNGSSITVVTSSDTSRGYRANGYCAEEFRMIDKKILDSVITPFLVMRQPPYMMTETYANIKELEEEPKEVYISSAWLCNHWMWPLMLQTVKDMFAGKPSTMIGMDYSVTLKHKIKSRAQLLKDKHKVDPITWMLEYCNLMLKENAGAYFSYALLNSCQTMKRAFYPRRAGDNKKKCAVERQAGEIRILSCDIAMIDNAQNDQSVYTLERLLPESQYDIGADSAPRTIYRAQVPYLESRRGTDTLTQAIRIKQLFYWFDCDYCVLDTRGPGTAVAGALGRVLYDEEFMEEYKPWCCMNNEDIAKHMPNPNGERVLYAITASSKLNSDMAVNLRTMFVDKRIDLLVGQADGIEELSAKVPEYMNTTDPEVQLAFEKPYLETMALISECTNLQYEKLENTGAIRLKERSGEMKDRYTSLAMGCYFASELERDLEKYADEDELFSAPVCVSKFDL